MPRPKKRRLVSAMPEVTVFKPAGVPRLDLEEIVLTVEELEAIRLKDVEDLDQAKCAELMNISRPTFQRVLGSSRTKVATMLTRGLALRVEGGSYNIGSGNWCRRCQQVVTPDEPATDGATVCPHCGAELADRALAGADQAACCGRGEGRRRRQRGECREPDSGAGQEPE